MCRHAYKWTRAFCICLHTCTCTCQAAQFKVMGRPNAKTHLLYKWQAELGEDCFEPHNGYMHCTLCNRLLTANRRVQLVRHLHCSGHMQNEFQAAKHEQQQKGNSTTTNAETDSFVDVVGVSDIEDASQNERSFQLDLCAALRSANIPLCVLDNGRFRQFLGKYTHRAIPDVADIYWACVSEIQTK
ncbi:uncharacterized protein [Drosophila virilis]|uniref:BED-type domain-containing protein n=1 Tax=Drosophila virilis TaxID=7244 RepID=B4M7U6_DROVI|nr:uncharacterized protein LOC6633854 [Drosophila virilis]EDW62863.2 uncharacterized protein Dvir_GJ17052 [Drosophila virilis]